MALPARLSLQTGLVAADGPVSSSQANEDQALQLSGGQAKQEQLRPPAQLLGAVAMLLALSVAGGVSAIGRSFSAPCESPCMASWGYQGCLGWLPTLSSLHVIVAVPLAAIATSALTVELGRLRSTPYLLATGVAATLAALLSFVSLMKPWDAFEYTDDTRAPVNQRPPVRRYRVFTPVCVCVRCVCVCVRACATEEFLANDVLQVFLGGGIFMTALPLAFAAFAAAADSRLFSSGEKAAGPSIDSVTDSTRRPFRAAMLLLLLYVAATPMLPPWPAERDREMWLGLTGAALLCA